MNPINKSRFIVGTFINIGLATHDNRHHYKSKEKYTREKEEEEEAQDVWPLPCTANFWNE